MNLPFTRPCHSALAVATMACAVHAQAPAAPGFPDSFTAGSLAFFIVHRGGPLAVRFDVVRSSPELRNNGGVMVPHAVFWQFYNADEKLVSQEYYRFTDDAELVRAFSVALDGASAGVYQFRYAESPASFFQVKLGTTPACPFGVLPSRTRMTGISQAWVYVPAGSESISVPTYATDVELFDEAGNALGTSKDRTPVSVIPDTVVQLRVGRTTGKFNVNGVPPILCPDAETARAIRGSVEVAPDGRVFAHKFQLRMWHWMRGLTAEDLAVDEQDLTALKEEWVKDPRNAGLLGLTGPFNHIPKILRDQDLDPRSPTYGKGISAAWLGPVYVIDKPFNPYRRNPAVLNRMLLGEFAVLLRLHENGTFDANNWNHYCGVDGLTYGKRAIQFGYVAATIEDGALRELWFEGVSKSPNRWAFGRVTCENQTSGFAVHLYSLFQGSGREEYRTLAHDFVDALMDPALNTFMKTGYAQERYGPDATYQGLCAAEIALYFKLSRDEAAKDGLHRIYGFLNHTVAPEPDGQVRGASNFSHRTAGSWRNRQYNAGFHLMSDELPEAGVWYPGKADRTMYDAEARALIEKRLAIDWGDEWYKSNIRWLDGYVYHPWVAFFHRYLYPYRELAVGTWPVLESDRFDKNVNGEFFFIRRPGYYVAVYTGSTMHGWVKASRKPVPLPPDSKREGDVLTVGKQIWHPTQGLCMFWTPQYGSLVLGKNWNAYTANLVRADLEENCVSWPDYWGFKHTYDADTAVLRLDWDMIDMPLHVIRTLHFAEQQVQQTLHLQAGGAVQANRIVEQIPFLEKSEQTVLFLRGSRWGEQPGGDCRRVWVGGAREGAEVEFGNPVTIARGPSSETLGHRMGLLEIELPDGYSAGGSVTLTYALRPASRP